jgi:hypothetical protein
LDSSSPDIYGALKPEATAALTQELSKFVKALSVLAQTALDMGQTALDMAQNPPDVLPMELLDSRAISR